MIVEVQERNGYIEEISYEYAEFILFAKTVTKAIPKKYYNISYHWEGDDEIYYLKKNGRWNYKEIDKIKYTM